MSPWDVQDAAHETLPRDVRVAAREIPSKDEQDAVWGNARRYPLGTARKTPFTGCRAKYVMCEKLAVDARDAIERKRERHAVWENASCHEKNTELEW